MSKNNEETLMTKLDKNYPGFVDSVQAMSVDQMEKRISDMQKQLEESEAHKEDNTVLKNLKEQVKDISSGYADVRKAVKIKTKYLIELIKAKGGK